MPKILKVNFSTTSLAFAVKQVLEWENQDEQHYIVTPNPEIILAAQKNHKFLSVLNKADFSIPDGIGILWASKYLAISKNNKSKIVKITKWLLSLSAIAIYPPYIREILPERVTGVDLMKSIIKQTKQPVFLLGAAPGIADKAAPALNSKNIVGTYAGSPSEKESAKAIKKINNSAAKILFVAYGAPAQELWIARHLKNLKNIKIAVGVGGSFDFISGTKKRAPKSMQKLGLEWLYRIAQEPKRIKRIYNATVKFPLTILRTSFKN